MIVIYCYMERENYKVSKYHANNSPYFEMIAAPPQLQIQIRVGGAYLREYGI